jgi:hypothetical protein
VQAELEDVAGELAREEEGRNEQDTQINTLQKEMDRLKDELETTQKELVQARAEAAAKPKVRAAQRPLPPCTGAPGGGLAAAAAWRLPPAPHWTPALPAPTPGARLLPPAPQVQVETVTETVEVRDTAKELMLESRVKELESKVDTLKKELEDANDRWGREAGGPALLAPVPGGQPALATPARRCAPCALRLAARRA